tara:strand:+ start:569 stop:1177 length:609 start_codon:yes stop_codon:yes gene_type:complete
MSIVKNPAQPSITNTITNIIAPSNASLGGGFFMRSAGGDAGLISEFVVTVGQATNPYLKDVYRGYQRSLFFPPFGSVSPDTFTIANGDVADADGPALQSLGFASPQFQETDPDDGGDNYLSFMALFPDAAASVPANTDANFFKSIKVINNNLGTETTFLRSDMTFQGYPATSGTGYRVYFTITPTALNLTAGHVIKVQLRSD